MTTFNRQDLRIYFLITVHYLKRNALWVIFILLLLFASIFLQLRFGIFSKNNTLSEGFIGTFQEHDLPVEVMHLISSPLTKIDENGRIIPNLVSGWVDVKGDATEFKFTLKDNLRWSNGQAIKSSDLDFSIPDTEVFYLDDKTILFKLKEAYSPFPSLLTKPVVKKNTLIGTGPYSIAKIEKSRVFITKLTLQTDRNDLPALYIRFYPNEKVGITGFSLGEVSTLFGVNSNTSIMNNPQVKIKRITDYSKITTVIFNTKDALLSNRSFRQALGFLISEIKGEEKADNPYPHYSWGYDPDAKKYLSVGKEAKAAFERAKTNIPADKFKDGIVLTSSPHLEQVGNQIINEWKSLGLDVKSRIEPGVPQNFQALLITQSIPQDPDQYLLWHSTQSKTNLSKYSSVRTDRDLEDGRKLTDEKERKSKYFDFQKTMLEDAPAIFLYFPKYNIVYLKKSEPLLQKVLSLQLQKPL